MLSKLDDARVGGSAACSRPCARPASASRRGSSSSSADVGAARLARRRRRALAARSRRAPSFRPPPTRPRRPSRRSRTTRPAPVSSRSTWPWAGARARRPPRISRSTSSSPTPRRCSTTSTPGQVDERARGTAPPRAGHRRPGRDRRAAAVGSEHDDAAGRGGRARRPVRGARADPARPDDRPGPRARARRAGAVGGVRGPRLRRRAAHRRAAA